NLGPTFLGEVVNDTDARGEQPRQLHAGASHRLAGDRIHGALLLVGDPEPLLFVAKAGIDGEVRQDRPAILEERRPVQGLDVHGQAFLAYHVATDRVSVGVEVADIGASGVRNGKPTRLHVPAGPDERRSCASPSNVGDLVDVEVETCLELVVAKCLHALGERELTGHARFVQVVEDGDVTEPVPGEGAVPDAGELVDGDAAGGFVSAELQNPVALVLIPV